MSLKISLRTALLAMGCCLLFCFVTAAQLQADEQYVQQSRRQSALVSDHPDPTEEVAREILQIQQQLGGSIVSDRPQLREFGDPRQLTPTPPQPPANYQEWSAHSSAGRGHRTALPSTGPEAKVTELRNAAWQLDTTANRLEHLDLYEQADALRDAAARLRRDARTMKRAKMSTLSTSKSS